MAPDCLLLVFSIVFCLCSILGAAWWRRKKYGIPIKATLLMFWQECIVNGIKKCRVNFIPVTKKVIGTLWECIKRVFTAIAAHQTPKPIKRTFTDDLELVFTREEGRGKIAVWKKKGESRT